MQYVKMIIEGEYWDSQIYSDKLALLDEHGAIHYLDWNLTINEIATKYPDTHTAIKVSFLNGDFFYKKDVRKMLEDKKIAAVIKQEFETLYKEPITFSENDLSKYWETKNNPFKFPPIDTEVYYDYLFASGDEGLCSIPFGTSTKDIKKHFDGKVFQIKASPNYTAIAAATGTDGLMDFNYINSKIDPNRNKILSPQRILSQISCNSCDWAFQSVIGWSYENAFLSKFKKEKNSQGEISRIHEKTIEIDELFNKVNEEKNTYFWGSHEKIYCIYEDGIKVIDYDPDSEEKENKKIFNIRQKEINEKFDSSKIISTGTAPFGTIIELSDKIIVIRSDDKIDEFEGEAIHWRVFPRSVNYSNQLHIIYDDRIEIISFIHDYFVNQKEKLSGFSRNCSNIDNHLF